MTSNQVRYAEAEANKAAQIRQNEENIRSNKARERENRRSNKQRELETRRSNVAKEVVSLFNLFKGDAGGAGALAKVLGNDKSWYNLNSTLVESAANINFETPLRGPIDLDGASIPRATVLSLQWVPAIGGDSTTAGKIRPIVIAAQNIYAWVRHANAGASNYEPNDLMMYLLAMDSAYTMYAFGRMIYRMCLTASAANLSYPQAWFKATGVDRDSFAQNLANFRFYLETVTLRLNALNVPANFPYFNRHVWMASNLFKDSNLDKTAYYYYKPQAYGMYDSVKGYIGFTDIPVELTLNSYQSAMNNILSHLYGSEDIGIISGDIKKAYGDSLFKIESTPIDDVAEPFYSMEVLQQINNTIMVGTLTSGTYDIFQVVGDQNSIFQGNATSEPQVPRIKLPTSNKTAIHASLLNVSSNVPTVDDIMVSTRNITLTATSSGSETYEYIDVAGSEIFTLGYVAYVTLDSGGAYQIQTNTVSSVYNSNTPGSIVSYLLAQMDWAPQIRYYGSTSKIAYLYDLENFSYLTPKILQNMHATALLSQFYIPLAGLKNIGNKVPR